jgi:hypothetical protein
MDYKEFLKDFEVSIATNKDKFVILSEPQLENLFFSHRELCETELLIIKYKTYKMLVQLKELKDNIWEIHIACPKDSLKANRILSMAIAMWCLKVGCPDIKALITSCPEGKIANMLRKIGASEVANDEGTLVFMATSKSFNLM